jgi:hypothetical protein
VKNVPIDAEDTWIWTGDEKFILERGDAVYAKVAEAGVTVSANASSLPMG